MTTPAPLQLASLPPLPKDVTQWRILLLVSAVNSLTQRVQTYLSDIGCQGVSTELALSDDGMVSAVLAHSPHVVLCPFLTKKVPEVIWSNVITLIVHPGPPGDAGPAAIDWAVLGDRGVDDDAAAAIASLSGSVDRSLPLPKRQRTHWGITVLQADNTMDGGPVWAWDQFPLPDVAQVTKSTIYQGPVANATIRAITVALTRISDAYGQLDDPSHRHARVSVKVDPKWASQCISFGQPFLGGKLHERPQIKPAQRRPSFAQHTAADVARIINCGDSQPGGTLKTTRSFIFVYHAKIHESVSDLPKEIASRFDQVPAGTALATRDGAVLFKTRPASPGLGYGVAVWITHGRLPKTTASSALPSKIPMAEALVLAGEGDMLKDVPEWVVTDFYEVPGTWQQVFVRGVKQADGSIVQFVHWDFYNGAMSTSGCQHLVRALQWATDPERGNVKVLALMGGGYFSNGVALNIIEAAEHPGRETWANINAIDDVVEVLSGDLSTNERSEFLGGIPGLTERGIITVACVRGNAAAGGVALAACCDIVLAGGNVVFNPAYRAMGLYGSEFHLYSYVTRTGRHVATHLLKDMLPLSAARSKELGLVDAVIGGRDITAADCEREMVNYVLGLASAPTNLSDKYPSAPWLRPLEGVSGGSLVELFAESKHQRYSGPSHTPLVHYRHEELSQMLLDSFHPVRSRRYHTRRIKFVRKVKANSTPTRFSQHRIHSEPDEEETPGFDDAPGWVRGEEWSWVGLQTPSSMQTSAPLRIDFGVPISPLSPASANSSAFSDDIRTDLGKEDSQPLIVEVEDSQVSPVFGSSPEGGVPSRYQVPIGSFNAKHVNQKLPPSRTTEARLAAPGATERSSFSSPLLERASRSVTNLVARPKPARGESDNVMPGHVTVPSNGHRNGSSKRRGSHFFGRLTAAFKSKTDLRQGPYIQPPPPVPGSGSAVVSPSTYSSVPSTPNDSLPAKNKAYTGPASTYNRPSVAEEGNTENPCLFNPEPAVEHGQRAVRAS